MQLSYKDKPHNKVDCFPLPNGYVDVFLHKNEIVETDEDGNQQYVAEEVYLQVEQSVTKQQIEGDFDYWWNSTTEQVDEPTIEERLELAESTILFLLGGM